MTGLVTASVRSSLAAHRAVFLRDRVTTLTAVEVSEQSLVGALDLDGAFRELLQQPLGHPGDLRLALHDLTEHHPVAGGQLGAQHRLIQPTQRPLEPLQRPGIQAPTSARRRSAPSRRSPHGNAAAGHPTVTWSDGTPRPSTPATPDAAGHRSNGPVSWTRTVRHSPPPPGPRRHDTRRGRRRRSAPTTPTTTSAPTTSHRTPPPPAPHDPTTSPDSRTATPTTSHCADHDLRAGLAGLRS